MTGSEGKDLKEVSLAADFLGVQMKNVVINPNKESYIKKLKEDASKKKKNIVDVISDNSDDLQTEDALNIKKENVDELIIEIEGIPEVDFPEGGFNHLDASLFEVKNSQVNKESENNSPSNKVTIMACKVCGEYFSTKRSLSKHMKKEHRDEKPKSFKCDSCDKQFSHASSLVSHKLLHTAFKCEFCDYASAQKGNLKSHRIRRHKENLN